MYMELEVQCTCMYDPNNYWIYISKTYCFCFLLSLNCENLAKQLLAAACNVLELISVRVVLCTICLTGYFFPQVAL